MKLADLNIHDIGNTIQIAGAVFADADTMFLCLFPDEHEERRIEVLNMDQADWAKFIRQTDILETQVLAQASDGKLAKIVLRKSSRQIQQNVSWAVYRRDGFRCRYCGANDVPLTVDHLVLWEEGGPSTEANLVSACRKCNKTRGNMQYAEWLQHPRYLKLSKRLPSATKRANAALVDTLDAIPRRIHGKSR